MNKKAARFIIYRATNLANGKVYIGFTTNFSARKGGHKFDSKTKDTKFCKAIRKYGWDNFEWDIILMSWDREHCLAAETELIKSYNSIEAGYNTHTGGRVGATQHGEANGMFGRTHTVGTKQVLAEAASKRFRGKSYEELYGTEKARELKAARSRTQTGRTDQTGKSNPRFKPAIIHLVNDDGREFTGTQYDFTRLYDDPRSYISGVVKGRMASHKGWRLISLRSWPSVRGS